MWQRNWSVGCSGNKAKGGERLLEPKLLKTSLPGSNLTKIIFLFSKGSKEVHIYFQSFKVCFKKQSSNIRMLNISHVYNHLVSLLQ